MAAATVPGVYAAALIELARERGALDAVVGQCRDLAKGLDASALQGLDDPRIGKGRAKAILLQVAEGAHELVLNLLALLVDRNRLTDAPAIFAEAVRQAEVADGVVKVEITLAVEATADLRQRVAERIRGRHGPKAQIHERVDPAIVAGFTARIGDRYLDASVRRRLDGLIQSMHEAPISDKLWAKA